MSDFHPPTIAQNLCHVKMFFWNIISYNCVLRMSIASVCDPVRDAFCSRALLTLAAAAAPAETHADAADDDEQHTTCSSCYQNHHIQRVWGEEEESVYLLCVDSTTWKLHCGAVALMPLTIHNLQLLGHTALGRPHTVG